MYFKKNPKTSKEQATEEILYVALISDKGLVPGIYYLKI